MPQNTPSAMRIVPSGQIYRQLFDAQFQLSQSLSQIESESRIQHVQPSKPSNVASLPIIRLNQDEMRHGILTKRQKSWVAGLPNDPYTENPVLYKQYSDYLNQKLQEGNVTEAEKEVNCLPDIVVAAKKESDVIERVTQSRRQRHEAALDDMHKALMLISMKMEKVIVELSTVLQNKLARSDEEIADILASIEKDEDLKTCQMEDLNALWEKIEEHATQRRQWIANMNSDLQSLEPSRFKKVRDVFTTFGKTLQNISFLMLPDLQRLLDKESQKINQAVLSNYRSYADLYVRLTSVDIEKEKTYHNTWLKRCEDWRILQTRVSVEEFKEFMKSDAIISPVGAEAVKATLLSDLKVLNNQRMEMIRTLCDMQPPNSTKLAVQKWRTDLKQQSEEMDNVMLMHLSKLHEEYEYTCKLCLEKVDSIKTRMIETGVCSSHTAGQVIDEFMLPLVGTQQRVFEYHLEGLQKTTEEYTEKTEEDIIALYKFARGAASLWDRHDSNLASQERELHEQVARIKKDHDRSCKELEAQLDSDLDRMRQDANETALKESLVKAFTLLDKIKESYEAAHEQQIKIVLNYPAEVNEELIQHDQAVCSYFSVARVVPHGLASKLAEEMDVMEVAEEESEKTEMKTNTTDTEIRSEAAGNYIPSGGEETITTSKGTEFYLLQEYVEQSTTIEIYSGKTEEEEEDQKTVSMGEEEAFLTEVKEEDTCYKNQTDGFAALIEVTDIPVAVFSQIKDALRMNFLEHLDDWCEQAAIRANTVVVTKSEELNGELDLRLHLHQPRPRRIELDVHNVRAAELVLHSERITRHCSGVEKSLAELRSMFKAMSLEHNKMARAFEDNIESLQEIFLKATKSARLVKLQNQVAVQLDKFMSSIRASLRQFHQQLDDTVLKLRGSNAKFIKSFRLFSDGGNFCPEEIDIYRKKLDRMSLLIDSAEGSIMSELESVESKYLESATKTASSFEDKFKSHMNDLIFMECITHGLTNIQVKIKAEVAKSNLQAQKISQMMKDLGEKVSAYGKQILDKEPVTASQINDLLSDIFSTFFKRNGYLHSRNASKVNKEENLSSVKDTFSREDKTTKASIDPSTGVIKSILKAQARTKEVDFSMDHGADALASDWEKNKSLFQDPNRASLRKISQGTEANKETSRKSFSGKSIRLDKKTTITGEVLESNNEADGGDNIFLLIIQNLVKETLDGLVTTAEVYYNQKGTRQITRPQAIPETCDQCADILSLKVQSYYSQAEVYHNQCLKDFQDQLTQLEQQCTSIPAVIIGDLLKKEVRQADDVQNKLTEGFQSKMSHLKETQRCLENELRPALGHPQRVNDLAELCNKEKQWADDYTELVLQHVQARQEFAVEHAKDFLEQLVEVSKEQLLRFDNMLIIDQIDKGKTEPKPQSTYELIRLMKSGQTTEEKTQGAIQIGRAMWTGIPSNQFFIGEKPSTLEITETVQTYKSTLAHSATIEARDKAYQDYKKYFDENLQEIEELKEKLLTSQANWDKSWEASVKKITSLYQKEQ